MFGNPLMASANTEAGAHANADVTITDHGISTGTDAFVGAEVGSKLQYDFGPVDLSLDGAARFGARGERRL